MASGSLKGASAKKIKKGPASKMGDTMDRQLHAAVAQANRIGRLLDKRLAFDIDNRTSKVVVKVIDKSSGKVLRVIPPGQMIRMAAHLKQLKVLNDRVIGAAESVILDHEC